MIMMSSGGEGILLSGKGLNSQKKLSSCIYVAVESHALGGWQESVPAS